MYVLVCTRLERNETLVAPDGKKVRGSFVTLATWSRLRESSISERSNNKIR